jgi:hypothetical protein
MEAESNEAPLARRESDAVSIAVLGTQIQSLKELMTEKLAGQDKSRDLVLEKLSGQDHILALIKEETTKTNGHVADAFREIAGINAWKNKITGALIISNIIILPMLMYIVYQHLNGRVG